NVQTALEQLTYVIDDLKQLDDLQASLPLARAVVKKLAPYRPERCRELLENLFERSLEQLEKKDKTSSQESGYTDRQHLRTLISMAAGSDAALAQKFVERIAAHKQSTQALDKTEASYFLAKELVNTDPRAALAIAERMTSERFTLQALEFIGSLRSK